MGVADDAALLERLMDGQIQGLVIAGMASGTIPEVAYQKVLSLAQAGLPIVLCSSATSGWTNAEYYYPKAYDGLRSSGVMIEDHLSPRKARIRLMLCLGLGIPYVPFGQEFVMR
jgi:L-asparaginase/Glu-tRNA(Gln) amidotransferase subunit D